MVLTAFPLRRVQELSPRAPLPRAPTGKKGVHKRFLKIESKLRPEERGAGEWWRVRMTLRSGILGTPGTGATSAFQPEEVPGRAPTGGPADGADWGGARAFNPSGLPRLSGKRRLLQ